jgi:hypothetical protein
MKLKMIIAFLPDHKLEKVLTAAEVKPSSLPAAHR